jgi:hypothetical protein
VKATAVGTLVLDFTNADHATMTATVEGATLTRPISRFGF